MSEPLRPGDVWLVNLNPVVGSEQVGRRPVIIVSGSLHLSLPHAVVFVVPITSRDRGLRHQIPIASQASGLSKLPSFARPEDARAVAYERLELRIGAVAPAGYSAYSLTCSRPRRDSDDPTVRNLLISVVSPRCVLGSLHGGIRPKCPQHRAGL
jgi:mRNA interferase MazF